MALLRNREVTIVAKTDGVDVSPTYTVLYPDNSRENVLLSELQLTEAEAKEMQKAHGDTVMTNVHVIKDADLQELRDSNNKEKIEARQAKERQSPQPVQVSKAK